MFRRRNKTSDHKAGGDLVPNAPNLADEDGGGWYKKPAPRGSDSDPEINVLPGGPLGIPQSAQSMAPTYYDGGMAPTYYDGGGGVSTSSPPRTRHQKKFSPRSPTRKHVNHSVDEFCAVVGVHDWSAATRMLDDDPKVVSKTAIVSLKGQRTVCDPLHLVVVSNPPVSLSLFHYFFCLCICLLTTLLSYILKLDFLERVLKEYPSAAHNPDKNGDRTALHWACIANASPAIIEIIAHANLGACKHQDRPHGRTPLHYLAMQANEPAQINALMDADMRASKVKDNSHKTPLDLAQDSSNPFKLDIIPALQARRSSGGLFSGTMKVRNRNSSPGKYKNRTASPGKYADPEGDNQGAADGGRPIRSNRSSRGRRTSRSEEASTPFAGASGTMPLRMVTSETDSDGPSRNAYYGTDSSEELDLVNGEFGAPPRLVQSTSASLYMPRSQFQAPVQSMASYNPPGDYTPPPRHHQTASGSHSPPPPGTYSNRSNSPKPTSSRDQSPLVRQTDWDAPPPRTVQSDHRRAEEQAHTMNSVNRASNSSQPRHSNQSIADGMDESIRELRIQLERKRGVLRDKDTEIAQISDQIKQVAREEGTMSRQLEQARSSAVDQNALSEKHGKVARLKQQIDELKAELRRTEKEVKKMESKSLAGSGNLNFMEQQLHVKKEEQSTLRAVMEALEDEKKSARREVDNIDSELKSLETIQMLAQGDDIG
jgi:hypothetical protein